METFTEIKNQSKPREQVTMWYPAKTDTSETCTTLCFPQNKLYMSQRATKSKDENKFFTGLCCIN